MRYTESEDELEDLYPRGPGDPDSNTPPWEIEKPTTPKVYRPRPVEYPESDNWAGSPEQAWA